MDFQYISFEEKESVGCITLNRPDVLNSFNRPMALELQEALDHCEGNKAIRAILLTGNGKGFSAGQDLAEAIAPDGPPFRTIVSEHYNPIINRIRSIEKPVVCSVNGVAAGAGANIALCCDVVFASNKASFVQAFSKIGLVPDSGGTFFLPRLIGWQKASALMMLGDKVSAEAAERMGMIYKVVEAELLGEESFACARKMAGMPTKAFGMTKQLLNKSLSNDLGQQLKMEEDLQVAAGDTSDYKEGVNAFLEKRAPQFKGE